MRVRKLGFLLALLLLLTAPLSRVQAAKLVAQYGAKGVVSKKSNRCSMS